jgi:hypothetical protein
MSNEKTHLFLPLACCAIFSAATFGGIGVAALTGQIAVAAKKENFLPGGDDPRRLDRTRKAGAATAFAEPTHVGLTRSAADDGKPMVLRVGQRSSPTPAPACLRCGVIDSIERHELQMPISRSATVRHGLTDSRSSQNRLPLPDSMPAKENQSGIFAEDGNPIATSFIVRLRMEDGSLRTIYEHQQPKFSVGEKVRLINGSVMSLS